MYLTAGGVFFIDFVKIKESGKEPVTLGIISSGLAPSSYSFSPPHPFSSLTFPPFPICSSPLAAPGRRADSWAEPCQSRRSGQQRGQRSPPGVHPRGPTAHPQGPGGAEHGAGGGGRHCRPGEGGAVGEGGGRRRRRRTMRCWTGMGTMASREPPRMPRASGPLYVAALPHSPHLTVSLCHCFTVPPCHPDTADPVSVSLCHCGRCISAPPGVTVCVRRRRTEALRRLVEKGAPGVDRHRAAPAGGAREAVPRALAQPPQARDQEGSPPPTPPARPWELSPALLGPVLRASLLDMECRWLMCLTRLGEVAH